MVLVFLACGFAKLCQNAQPERAKMNDILEIPLPWETVSQSLLVIASDRRERGNLTNQGSGLPPLHHMQIPQSQNQNALI